MDFNINPLHSPNYHIANTRPVLGSTLKLQRVQWNGWPRIKKKNKVTFRKERGTNGKGRNLIYKSYLRCHHCTRPRSSTADLRRTSKNTRCPARLIVTLQRTDFLLKTLRKRHYIAKKSNTAHDNLFPCLIEIKHKHNH